MICADESVIAPWVCRQLGATYTPGTSTALGRIKNGRIVGGITYSDFNGANVMCGIASDGQGWLNKQFLSVIFDYPFNQLQVKRMTAVIASDNQKSIHFVERLGFELEAILQDAHPNGDLRVYKMTRDACRWLKELPYEFWERRRYA